MKISLKIGKITKDIEVHIMERMKEQLLLGLDTAEHFKLTVDLKNRSVSQEHPSKDVIMTEKTSKENEISEALTPKQDKKLQQVLQKYKDIFAKDKTDIGTIKVEQHSIALNNNMPIHQKPYRTSQADNQEISRQITDLLKKGLIQPSMSPYAAPVILANKKGEGKTRLCIDYRKLNNVTIPDHEPIPRMDDLLDQLSNVKYFTSLDVTSGYWHVKRKPENVVHKSAFVTQQGHYEWMVMPFGLKNAPATFQRTIKTIIRKHNLKNVLNYFDDPIIYSDTFENHIELIEKTLKILKAEGIKLKEKKCEFAKTALTFLGHRISHGSICPNPKSIEAISNYPQPKNPKEVQRFLGTIDVYGRFIPQHAKLRYPLTNLLKKDSEWKWDESCQESFQLLKRAIISEPILAIYDPKLPCSVYVDACQTGIGAVLKQTHSDGIEHPVCFHSRKLLKLEANYTITELEGLA